MISAEVSCNQDLRVGLMNNLCIVLQGRVILEDSILSISLSGRAIFHSTLPRGYISQYVPCPAIYGAR